MNLSGMKVLVYIDLNTYQNDILYCYLVFTNMPMFLWKVAFSAVSPLEHFVYLPDLTLYILVDSGLNRYCIFY